MATSIDNPFAVARNRSEKAGEVLADALINKAQGERPVTLIGYSLGARVIYSCLKSLAERKAFGLVESVVFIGAPVPSNSRNWRVMRSVVSGKVVNVYSENDYILAFLYRATSIQFGVAGLQTISDVEGVENLNLSKEVSGHLRYPDLIGKILKKAGFNGIKVEDMDIEEEQVDEVGLINTEVDADAKVVGMGDMGDLIDFGEEPAEMDAGSAPPYAAIGQQSTLEEQKTIKQQSTSGQQPAIAERRDVVDVTSTMSQVHLRDDESESDDGGIQMVDNDDDGEMIQVESVPTPDDNESHEAQSSRAQRVEIVEDQKFLGSFPKGKKKVTALEMGLY